MEPLNGIIRTSTSRIFEKRSGSPEIGPKGPKMTQNGPKTCLLGIFLENGSNDFSNFWHEVST
jgi:hypothetical protein